MKDKDILIIEDDKRIVGILNSYLKQRCNVHIANTINEARMILRNRHIDLICQDVVLPDGNGLNFCNEVKNDNKNIKIIVLTKRVEIKDRLNSFESGADDYLPKPFYPEELYARIKRLLLPKISGLDMNKEVIEFKDIKLNIKESSLVFNKQKVLLSKSERLIMEGLMLHEGHMKSNDLIKYLSTKTSKVLTINAFTVCINRLKTKLEKILGRKLISSRYAFGYFLKV